MRLGFMLTAFVALALTAAPAAAQESAGNLGRVEIVYEDGLDDLFQIVDSLFKFDGVPIHPTLSRGGSESTVVYSGLTLPGSHKLSVMLKLKGATSAIFTYLEGYKLNLRQAVTFSAKRGEALRIVIRTVDRGFTYDFTRRAMMQVERVPLGPASVLAPKASAAR